MTCQRFVQPYIDMWMDDVPGPNVLQICIVTSEDEVCHLRVGVKRAELRRLAACGAREAQSASENWVQMLQRWFRYGTPMRSAAS